MYSESSSWRLDRGPLRVTPLWLVAVLFYGIGDIVTTKIGLGFENVVEAGPISSLLISRYGFIGMIATKLGILGFHYLLWRALPTPHRAGIPLGLSIVGVTVTLWNFLVLFVVIVP